MLSPMMTIISLDVDDLDMHEHVAGLKPPFKPVYFHFHSKKPHIISKTNE
jgi:hypothetical protein